MYALKSRGYHRILLHATDTVQARESLISAPLNPDGSLQNILDPFLVPAVQRLHNYLATFLTGQNLNNFVPPLLPLAIQSIKFKVLYFFYYELEDVVADSSVSAKVLFYISFFLILIFHRLNLLSDYISIELGIKNENRPNNWRMVVFSICVESSRSATLP